MGNEHLSSGIGVCSATTAQCALALTVLARYEPGFCVFFRWFWLLSSHMISHTFVVVVLLLAAVICFIRVVVVIW